MYNKTLHLTSDPAGTLAVARPPSASIATEHPRYAAQDTLPLVYTADQGCRRRLSEHSGSY